MLSISSHQAQGALLGLLIGDAVGVPYEFSRAQDLPEQSRLEMSPPQSFPRAHQGVPEGTWSDDGAQALALLDSLLHDSDLDLNHFAANLVAWFEHGRFTPDGRVFDVGIQTGNSLRDLASGVSPEESGRGGERDNGNGSLMRAMGCLLVPFTSEQALVLRAMRQSLPTHSHARSQVACALYCVTAWHLALGSDSETALADAFKKLPAFLPEDFIAELSSIQDARPQVPRGSGYVVDSFWAAWHAFASTNNFKDCVQVAVALGGDTDTTACIAGGLAGLKYELAGLPRHWVSGLQGKNLALETLVKGWPTKKPGLLGRAKQLFGR